MLHGIEQHRMREEVAILNHQFNARDVHVHDAAGANVEVSDFAVTHLPLGQSDGGSARLNERVGIFTQETIIGWLVRHRDRIGLGFGTVSPAVENDEDKRFGTQNSAPSFSHSRLTWGTCATNSTKS